MKITSNRETKPGPADWFTGDVTVEMLFGPAGEGSQIGGSEVTFQAGARTAWHTHPLGQTLFVTSGAGWVQVEGETKQAIKSGDVVQFAPGEKHWHGATDTSAMSHIAIQEAKDGKAVDWMEQVGDEDYLS